MRLRLKYSRHVMQRTATERVLLCIQDRKDHAFNKSQLET